MCEPAVVGLTYKYTETSADLVVISSSFSCGLPIASSQVSLPHLMGRNSDDCSDSPFGALMLRCFLN